MTLGLARVCEFCLIRDIVILLMILEYRRVFDFVGRFCLAAAFAISIPPKLSNFSFFVRLISQKGIHQSISLFLLISAIFCLVFGVGFILFSDKQNIGSTFLLVFLIPTTLIMHLSPFEPVKFFMNLGLIGGLTISLTRSIPYAQSSIEASIASFITSFYKTIKNIFHDKIN
ncbi:DoxX family membrane protein [Prochlorococcus sp. MIT 1223]|uniref:DoxX family membrane protein n=1 Tax=Prochlorococcus sp. MIT 1223 TaxID=3096217 RepID=UPI002A763B7A|nr:DoxX family membrane protein [Prochlorococcus sp. MIT 1223]